MMKKVFSCFLSVASVFSSCFITKAETTRYAVYYK
jgi:hypothetical protein